MALNISNIARLLRLSVPLALLVSGVAGGAERPNILLIVGDDVGWGDIRPNNANGKVLLPAIERLSQEGIRFTDAHTSAAKCAPSRYSIITGNYQWRGRLSWGTWKYKGGSQILLGQETLGGLMKRAGYATAFVGKYHLGAHFFKKNSDSFASGSDLDTVVDFARAMADGPNDNGFDYSFVAMRGIQAGPYAFFENGRLYGNPSDLITWRAGDYGDTGIVEDGIGLPTWVTRQVGPTLLDKSIEFLESHQVEQEFSPEPKPFFLYLNTQAVHGPFKPPFAIGDRPVNGASGLGSRTDMLIEIDVIVDNVLRNLEQRGLLHDTLIIFTSDNGAVLASAEWKAGHDSSGGFRGHKGTIYEGGHRVPLIMKWGSRAFGSSPILPGTASSALVGIQDLYATLAELVAVPVGADQARDSFSILPILMGQATLTRDHMVHEADTPEKNALDGGIAGNHFAYRSGTWKLVFNSSESPVALYNLAEDPFETRNLVSQAGQSDRVAVMNASLKAALAGDRTAPPTGVQSFYSVSPSTFAFGNVVVGTTSAGQAVTITNTGTVVLPIASISRSGANPGQFTHANGCPTQLAVGAQCTATVSFKPTSTGGKSATLTITPGGGATVKTVALSGTGITGSVVPTCTLSPTSLSFGSRTRGTTSAAKTVTVTNTGAVVLPITSSTLFGANPGQFSQTSNCPAQVAAGAECTISVYFKPTTTGSKSATLKVTPGGGANAKTVTLTGTGT